MCSSPISKPSYVIKPSLQSSASLLSIEHKKPAFVELFTAENVKVIESEVVVVNHYLTGSRFHLMH